MPDTFIDRENILGKINKSYWYLLITGAESLEMVMSISQK